MARSALIASKALEHYRRRLKAPRQRQRIWEIIEITFAWNEVAGSLEAVNRTLARQGGQDGHRTAPVCYLHRLARFDPSEKLTRSLPQLPHSDAGHVLVVAH